MEGFVEEQKIETIDAVSEFTVDQNNVLFESDAVLENLEITMEQDKVEDDKNREGYEKVVDGIKEEKNTFIEEKSRENEDESHETVDYLEGTVKDRRDIDLESDEKADDIIDNTQDMVEEMEEDQADLEDRSRIDLENSEDFVESLRDINISEIDEEMKNALGDQFPEGMTEEIYTLTDENGLMTSYVVRRIVVRNGAGNVYEKVQTKFGTVSYTCNGHGITEFEWQDQTAAADLVRN